MTQVVQVVPREREAEGELRLVGAAVEDPVDRLLTAGQVATILCVRAKRVYELGIPAVRISERALRWRRRDVTDWIEARRTT